MKIREQYKQLQATSEQIQVLDAHFRNNKEAYLFGAGVAVGVIGMRLVGRPSVVINNVVQQGGCSA